MKKVSPMVLALACGTLLSAGARADNPLLMDVFAADPTARLFEGKIYLYPSHDILPPAGTRGGGFRMEDYHAYSSDNFMDWKDHGVLITQNDVPWVNPTYGMWAPDCVFKNGKYYFYFPAPEKPTATAATGAAVPAVAMPGGGTNPGSSIQSVLTDLTGEEKAKLTAMANELNAQLQSWQTSSQAILQPLAPPRAGRGGGAGGAGGPGAGVADPAATDKYNAELFRQNQIRADLLNDAETKMVAMLKPEQAEKWETARLSQQVTTSLGTLGLTGEQKAKIDSLVPQAAKALAAAKDKTARAGARVDFWNRVVGVLSDAQITRVFTTAAPAGRGAGGGGGGGRGGVQRVGVAVAERPFGPFKPEPTAIPGIPASIDPCCLIDPKDGSAYLFYSMNAIFVAKLKDNMLELAEQPKMIPNLPTQGLVEGPFAFERNGKYYLTFPHGVGTERLEYAMADNPMGPYTMTGILMDQLASRCWTNHQSLVEYKGQWYLFYHDNDFSPTNDAKRSARAEFVTFNADGTMQKVIPTLRGVGVCEATRKIQIDRYSAVGQEGTAVSYLNADKTFDGWKIALSEKGAFVRYDRVEFGKTPFKAVKVRANSSTGGTIEVRLDKADGPVVAKVAIPKNAEWKEISANLTTSPTDLHNLVVTMPEKSNVEIDWVSFE